MSRESFSEVKAVVEANQFGLLAEQNAAVVARQDLVAVTGELDNAETALKAAQLRVETAKAALVESQLDVGAAHNKVAKAARDLATIIINTPGDVVARTLYSIVYQDETLARNDDFGTAYPEAIKKSEMALGTIWNRLRPGEPVLHLGGHQLIVGKVPEEDVMLATLPRAVTSHSTGYTASGSINLPLVEAVIATTEESFATTEKLNEWEINLVGPDTKNKVRRLIEASENTSWLVIGKEGIATVLESNEPRCQLVAMTALKEAGIEVPFVLDEKIRTETAANLIAYITYLATEELIHVHKRSEDGLHIGSAPTVPVQSESEYVVESAGDDKELDNKYEKMKESVTGSTLRSMAKIVGLSQETIKETIEIILKDVAAEDDKPYVPGSHSEEIDATLAAIFDS